MKRINKEQFLAGCSLTGIGLLFGSFLSGEAKHILSLGIVAGIVALYFLFKRIQISIASRKIISLLLCVAMIGNWFIPASATAIEVEKIEPYSESSMGIDRLTYLRNMLAVSVETYGLNPEMSDNELANVFLTLDSEDAYIAWENGNTLMADAQGLSAEERHAIQAEANTQLCLRLYGIVGQIVNSAPSLAAVSGSSTLADGLSASGDDNATWAIDTERKTIHVTVNPKADDDGCSTEYSQNTSTLTLTPKEDANLTVQITTLKIGTGGSVKIGTDSYTTNGTSKTYSLTANNPIYITVASGSAEGTATELELKYSYTPIGSNVTLTFQPVVGIPYKVNGTSVNGSAQEISGDPADGFAIVAEDTCYIPIKVTLVKPDGSTDSLDVVGGTIAPQSSGSVTPVFAYDEDSDGIQPFKVDTNLYWDLSSAIAAAGTTKTIILNDDYTLPSGSYTIPSGVTLLIPFDVDNTLYTTQPGSNGDSYYATPSIYRTLKMAEGAHIVVDGALSLSAKQGSNQTQNGSPAGPVSIIDMASGSSITVNSGGNLYAWGYIYSSGSNAGTVLIKNGATVYEDFEICDWRGGSFTKDVLKNSQRVFPLSQYYVQNVQVPMTLESGAKEIVSTAMSVTLVGLVQPSFDFLGKDTGLFRLTSGTVTRAYDKAKDRMIYTVNGQMGLSNIEMSLKLSVLGSATINSKDYVLPVNGNLTIATNSGSEIDISHDFALLPGANFTIAENAKVKLTNNAKVFVYDLDNWGNYCSASNVSFCQSWYTPGGIATRSLSDAVVVVNGTLDASGGSLYTTEKFGGIASTGTGTVITTKGTDTVTYQVIQGDSATWVGIPITPAKLKHQDETYLETTTGTYTHKHYVASGNTGKWDASGHTETETTTATCEAAGITTYTCSCGVTRTENTPALGHSTVTDTAKTPTCTETGLTEGSHCSVCNTVLVAQEIIDALGHTEVTDAAKAPTCTETGLTEGKHCSVCGTVTVAQTEVPAKGHTEVTDAAKAPTCTESGLTEGKHCSVCGTVTVAQTAVPANGHTEVIDAAKAPTCTESGLTEGKHCSVCGVVTVPQESVPFTGHAPSETWETATYEKPLRRVCDLCGEVREERNSVKVGNVEYLTLREALDGNEAKTLPAVSNRGTITLLTDISYAQGEDPISKNLIFECGEYAFDVRPDEAKQYEVYRPDTENGNTIVVKKTPFNIAATNVAVDDSLDLFFYIWQYDLEGKTDYTAEVTKKFADGRKDVVETIRFDKWEYKLNGGVPYYRFKFTDISAKEMMDNIYVKIYDGNGTVVSNPNAEAETIEKYVVRTLKDTDAEKNGKLVTALVDMLNYGASTQKYFGYNNVTEKMANINITEFQQFATSNSVIQNTEIYKNNQSAGVYLTTTSVSAKNQIMLTFYYDEAYVNPTNSNDLTAELSYIPLNGKNEPLTWTVSGKDFYHNTKYKWYGVDVTGIPIADGNQVITCTIKKGDQVISTSQDSIGSFCVRNMDKGEAFEAMLKFVDSAYEYFRVK